MNHFWFRYQLHTLTAVVRRKVLFFCDSRYSMYVHLFTLSFGLYYENDCECQSKLYLTLISPIGNAEIVAVFANRRSHVMSTMTQMYLHVRNALMLRLRCAFDQLTPASNSSTKEWQEIAYSTGELAIFAGGSSINLRRVEYWYKVIFSALGSIWLEIITDRLSIFDNISVASNGKINFRWKCYEWYESAMEVLWKNCMNKLP